MIGPAFREPVSAWTHFVWLAAAVPALIPLWRAAGRDPLKRRGAMVFGGSLVFCSAGSFLFHSVPTEFVAFFRAMDHIGIFLLIAGTVTPIGLVVLDGRWRLALVGGIWTLAFFGVSLRVGGQPPIEVMTALYLFMGWVGCLTYCELARRLTHAGLRPLWVGGLFYTAGAAINSALWPNLAPGVFESHELFHLFVMAGSACHFLFITRVVLPYHRPVAQAAVFEPCSFALEDAEDGVVVVK
jgi:hemolysin III